ncbi:MAG: site-2 protease family protein [Thermoanaerobaculia bacterium]|nr:site-2 protease family protein [Thermoanaerobaculia bacterium]
MFGRKFELFTLFGFKVGIDASWFILAILITWSLATGYFPYAFEDLSTRTYWVMGVVGALGLFGSVVLHEFAHSWVARRNGLPMKGITLFIFGGVAEMSEEPPSPRVEFRVAVAGPIASIAIAAVAYATTVSGRLAGWPVPVVGVLSYLAMINLVLVAFNAVPAFPLDGGRVLRSFLWSWKDSLRWATRVTSKIGAIFGLVLIVLGVLSVLAGDFIGGMWWFLIGLFLRGAAQSSYQQLLMRQLLEGEPVRRFMNERPISVERSLSVRQLVEEFVYRHHHKLFPVVEDDRIVGCVTTRDIKELPRDEWERQSVGAIAEECSDENTVGPDEDAMKALARMTKSGNSRLMVVEDGRLIGILSLKDLLELFRHKIELEDLDETPEAA